MRRREFIKAMAALPLAGVAAPSTGESSSCSGGFDIADPGGDRSAVWIAGQNGDWEFAGWAKSIEMKLVPSRVVEYRVGDIIAPWGTNP